MSLLKSLNTGASGIRSHSQALGVVGDNIANVNTVGYKRSRANFQDVLGRAVTGSSAVPEHGSGSRVSQIQHMWTQGALLTTDSPTDVAISGRGFFVVNGNVGGISSDYYTRAGQFNINNDGMLVNTDGHRVQGYQADATGTLSGQVSDMQVSNQTIAGRATTAVTIGANLNAEATTPTTGTAFDPADPENTSNFSNSVTIYDSLGNAHDATVYYRKDTTAGNWTFNVCVDGGDIPGGTAGVLESIADGRLSFTTDGALQTDALAGGAASASVTFTGASAQAISFDFGESIDEVTAAGGTATASTGLGGTTQFATESTLNAQTQDGFGAGSVAALSIGSDGAVTGVFTNGQRRTLGQLVVAEFASIDGLERAGDGLFTATQESGDALLAAAGSGTRGSVVSGALEASNVDLAHEFVDLIAYQRGFSANGRIITTTDDMYTELVNLKR